MEFFKTIHSRATEQELQRQLQVDTLPRFCTSIYEVIHHEKDQAEISMLWGLFNVRRECIRGGVRFSLPNCLNAVVWSITISPDDDVNEITVHCTINRKQQDADFVESLEDFVEDWRKGLSEQLQLTTDSETVRHAKHG